MPISVWIDCKMGNGSNSIINAIQYTFIIIEKKMNISF